MFAGGVLAFGAGGALHVVLLAATLFLGVVATHSYLQARRTWTAQRLQLTHDLAEAMVGHATRLAQGDHEALAESEDRALVRYLVTSRTVDRAHWRINVLVPRGWPLVAALGLVPALVYGAPSAGEIAAALGGILYAADALGRLSAGATRIADAAIAWRSIEALFDAAATSPDVAPPSLALGAASQAAPAVDARALTYRYAGRGAPVLVGCDLVVARGDRVLIQGPSGSGKSTLAAIVAGMRRPDSGLVLASGLDRVSVGAFGWRRRVACAPQFHDNHVFGGTLLFNLLMARGWPPSQADVAAAEAICRDLGLGPLLDRMPAGIYEQVGETGWQLSHGERSRVFLARALLQGADVVLLDESIAALDPENLAIALRCIEAHASTAIVIAHP
jgi:ATP-binding cassette subfamily B protein